MMVSDRAKIARRMTRPISANPATVSDVGETRRGRVTGRLRPARDLRGAECIPSNPRADSSHPHRPGQVLDANAHILVAGRPEQGKVRGLRLEELGHHIRAEPT